MAVSKLNPVQSFINNVGSVLKPLNPLADTNPNQAGNQNYWTNAGNFINSRIQAGSNWNSEKAPALINAQPVQNFINMKTPGGLSVGQVFQNAWNNNAFQTAATANTGFTPLDNIGHIAGQMAGGVFNGLTLGALNTTSKPQGGIERGAYQTGQLLGMLNPYSLGSKILSPIQLATEGKIAGSIANVTAPNIIKKVLPAVGGEIAQNLAYTGYQKATGQENPNLLANIGFGLGMRGAMGGIGKFIPKSGMVMKKTYDEAIANNEYSIKDVIARYELTHGSAYDPTNPRVDLDLEKDAHDIWKLMFGKNKKPPEGLDRVIGQIYDGFQGWRTEKQMGGLSMGVVSGKKLQDDSQAGLSDTRGGALLNKNAKDILDEIAKPRLGLQGKVLSKEEQNIISSHLLQNSETAQLRGTVYKPYGGKSSDKEIVFGVIKDRQYPGQVEYLVTNSVKGQGGNFRLHSTPISQSEVIGKINFDNPSLPSSVAQPSLSDIRPQTMPGDFSNSRSADQLLANKNKDIPLGNPDPLPWETEGGKVIDRLNAEFENKKIASELKSPELSQSEIQQQGTRAMMNAEKNKKGFNQLFAEWIGKRDAARTTGTQVGAKYKTIPTARGREYIKSIENPSHPTDPHIKQTAQALHNEYERLYKEATDLGIDIGHRENYITHYWQEDNAKVAEEYQRLKQREGFQNERVLPTYEEGLRMGLKPKFENPAQIVTEYATKLEQLKANLDFFKKLKEEGFIVDAAAASRLPGFEPINGIGFPQSSKTIGGTVIKGSYYAPANIARQINKIFSPEDSGALGKVAGVGAKVSSNLQNIGLSGGIPMTPMNAFTIAQMQKEMLAGRVVSPLTSFVRSMSGKASNEFFEKNAGQLKKMQVRNIPISTSFTIDNLIDKNTVNKTLGEKAGGFFHKMMDEPTFKRFLPMMQVNLFNDIEKQALKGGKGSSEAADIAAKAVKNFYGVIGSDVAAKRGQLGKDILSTVAFAPQFRESMVNFWIQNAKALRHPLALENRQNLKFMTGAILTLGAMNYLNQQLNGHSMLDNPPGKEDKLLIPLNDGKGTVIGVPFLSSIGTVPRALFREGKAALGGDFQTAGKDFMQSFTSMLLKPPIDVATNQDYFGKEIVSDTDTPQEKLLKQGKYLASQYTTHPYAKELLDPRNQQDPLYQRASRATELPFRFYTQDSLAKGQFYDEYYKLKPYADQYQELSYKDPQKAQEFLQQNQDKLDRFNYMKQVQSAYYDGADSGNPNTSLLTSVGKSGTPQGVTTAGNRVIYKDSEGNWQNVNLAKTVEKPKLTGNAELDKKLISEYNGQLTRRANDIKELYQIGQLSAEEANKQLVALKSQRLGGGSRKAPKMPKLTFKAIKAKKIKIGSSKLKLKSTKLKLKEIKPKELKVNSNRATIV